MIDDQLRLSPQVVDAAVGGDDAPLRAALPTTMAAEIADALVAAVQRPVATVHLLRATHAEGLLRQRALIGAELALLIGDGDDRDAAGTVLLARPGVALVHLLIAGVGFGVRPADDEPAVDVETPDVPTRFALGEMTELVARPEPDTRPVTWWALRWELDETSDAGQALELDETSATGQVVVLDAARLWDHDDLRLHPTDAVTVWTHLAPLLDAVARATAAAERAAGRDPAATDASAPGSDTPT